MNEKLLPCHRGNFIHGLFPSNKELFNIWQTMKSRCENKKRSNYARYGGRGITVCKEWRDYSTFRNWSMENGYNPDAAQWECTIYRIDPNGNYEPSNCRWVNMSVQNSNKRKRVS